MGQTVEHLNVAAGYLELGMMEDAAAEIEKIAPADRSYRWNAPY